MFLKGGGWLVSVALLLGLIQSVTWIILSVASALVYLCVIPVPPYKNSGDFLLVTTVKLYFEGPECIPDGSYLGKFNQDYRNRDVLRLFTPDKVFAVMVAYSIFNAVYLILSIKFWFNRKPKSAAAARLQKELFLNWSAITLIICAIDVIFIAKMIGDLISLNDYMGDKSENSDVFTSSGAGSTAEIPYIPLLLALVSSRFICIWLWNFIVGLLFFLNALCCRNLVKDQPKTSKEQEAKYPHVTEEVQPATGEDSASKTLANGTYISAYDILSHSDVKKSSEAVTRFSSTAPKTIYPKEINRNWSYVHGESCWQSTNPIASKDSWEMTNEGYVSDEQVEPEKSPDFEHDLKNFEQGQRKIKIVKPPIGKPVEKGE